MLRDGFAVAAVRMGATAHVPACGPMQPCCVSQTAFPTLPATALAPAPHDNDSGLIAARNRVLHVLVTSVRLHELCMTGVSKGWKSLRQANVPKRS